MLSITELTCRVCLQEQPILINVYDELEDLHTNLSKLLETCVDLQINENDKFPKYLCEECTRELLITSKFREKCDNSKKILYELLEHNEVVETGDLDISNDIIEYCEDETVVEMSDLRVGDSYIVEEREQCESNLSPDKQPAALSLLKKNDTKAENNIQTYNQKQEKNGSETLKNGAEGKTVILSVESLVESQIVSTSTSSPKYLTNKLKKNHIFKCDICGAIFKQAINLQKHLQKSHDPSCFFICEKCDHWFSIETEFCDHMLVCNHLKASENNCDENKKIYKTSGQTLEQEMNRKCSYCEREFPTPFALRMHLRTHTGERPFHCKYCTKSFKTQSQLNVHHKRHIGQADFICTICQKAFYEQSNLTVHMRSHTGERPHICTICKKTFARVFLLQFHLRTHTGEKPYTCTYCSKSFRQGTDLRNHVTIHTGQKQHSCIVCNKSYIKRSHLVQHMRKHKLDNFHVGTGESVLYEKEQITDDLSQASNEIKWSERTSDIVYSFDEIIESEDVVLQSEKFGY